MSLPGSLIKKKMQTGDVCVDQNVVYTNFFYQTPVSYFFIGKTKCFFKVIKVPVSFSICSTTYIQKREGS